MNPNFSKDHASLAKAIIPILAEKGFKNTTMDLVAHRLGMSKRTLYEIYGSKSDMLDSLLVWMAEDHKRKVEEVFETSANTLEALMTLYFMHRDTMQTTTVEFFRDMDRLYKRQRLHYDQATDKRHTGMVKVLESGVKEGLFRPELDYDVQVRIMGIQMESLKRMEEIFPHGIDPLEVYDAIILGFLRSIATPKGMALLDSILASKPIQNNIPSSSII